MRGWTAQGGETGADERRERGPCPMESRRTQVPVASDQVLNRGLTKQRGHRSCESVPDIILAERRLTGTRTGRLKAAPTDGRTG